MDFSSVFIPYDTCLDMNMNIEVIHVYKEKRHYKEVEDTSINGLYGTFYERREFLIIFIYYFIIHISLCNIQKGNLNTEDQYREGFFFI